MRLIDADALLERMEGRLNDLTKEYGNRYAYTDGYEEGYIAVEEAPTVERPRGEWIMHDDEILGLSCECSACHIETLGNPKFCPNCGADMRGEGE